MASKAIKTTTKIFVFFTNRFLFTTKLKIEDVSKIFEKFIKDIPIIGIYEFVWEVSDSFREENQFLPSDRE